MFYHWDGLFYIVLVKSYWQSLFCTVFLQIKRKIEWSTRTIECKGKDDKLSTCLKSSVFNKNMGLFFFAQFFQQMSDMACKGNQTFLASDELCQTCWVSWSFPGPMVLDLQLVSWDFPHLAGYFWRAWARLRVLSWNQTLISFLVQSQALCSGSDISYSIAGFLSISYFYFTGDSYLGKGASFLFQWYLEKEKSQIELIYLLLLDAFFLLVCSII